ncbi:MAG: HD domain-containing protein [Candidatus Ranarchaeia archaeon]|jgi:HD superfamily phosphohydrolase
MSKRKKDNVSPERFDVDIRDPLHGYILLSPLEEELLDTRGIQRLHNIRQLAGAYLTYPGADHTRFGHSLGTKHLAGLYAQRLVNQQNADPEYVELTRIAGLLHDIGHGPFSHTFEHILHRYRKTTHEDMTTWLIKTSEIGDTLTKHGIDKNQMASLAVGKVSNNLPLWMGEIISGHFDADKLDFLKRDAYYTGVEYGQIDTYRLIFGTAIHDGRLALNSGVLYALEGFLIARYEMFKAVYFHKTVRAAEIMFARAMDLAKHKLGLTAFETPDQYLDLDDGMVMTGLRMLKGSTDPEEKQAYEIYHDLARRRLLKVAKEKLVHSRDPFISNLFAKAPVKDELEIEIADKAKVDPAYVFIDIPTLPSIPHNPNALDPMEIPVFEYSNGNKKSIKVSNVSGLIGVLKGYMDVLRCYTFPKYRKEVNIAAEKVFGELPTAASISY